MLRESEPELHFLDCPEPGGGSHRMAWWSWGDPMASHAVLCVHGLTRQGRDFDRLAQVLLARAEADGQALRVVCPDIVGRGRSDWLKDAAGYQYQTYVADIHALLGALKSAAALTAFDWVGTSMGGVIGILIAAESQGDDHTPLRRLVLNDVGPVVQWDAIARIGEYVDRSPRFTSLDAAAQYLRDQSEGFGPCPQDEWLAFSRPEVRELSDGTWGLRHDPGIASAWGALTPEKLQAGEALLWNLYDRIRAPTLLLHGAESDLLSAETAQAMAQRGPRARVVDIAGVGHAPMLVAADQTALVSDFLLPPG